MKIFKLKVLYIVLIIIATLAMIAVLILRFAVSSGMPSGMPGNFTPPTRSESDSGSSERTMPEGFDPSNMPNFNGGTSSDSDSDSDSGNSSNRPSFPGSGMPDSGRSGSSSVIRNIWLPVVIVCALIDAFSVFMLIKISKDEKKNQPPKTDNDPDHGGDGSPRKKKPVWAFILVPVVIIGIVLAMLPSGSDTTSSVSVNQKVITSELTTKTITTNYLSGGVLAEESSSAFTLPGDIEIDSYEVSNGDAVSEGDLIATVNKASVLYEINEIQEIINDLDDELKDSKSDDSNKITAPVDGRVKAIFTSAGTSVVDTMTENGALIILSLDGLMKAEIPDATGLSVGDSVKVRLSDGTEYTGRISTVQDGKATVTISDKTAKYGDSVTVLKTDGTVICTSTLDVNSCLKITGYHGIASKINVKVNATVEEGDTLITLKNSEHTSDYHTLLTKREKLSAQMSELLSIYSTGEIRATVSGVISGIDDGEEDVEESEEEDTTKVETYSKGTTIKKNTTVLYEDEEIPLDGAVPAESTEEPADATEEPSEATEEPAEPTGEPSEPTETPAEPTGEPSEPTGAPSEPTGAPADPTAPSGGSDSFRPDGSNWSGNSPNMSSGSYGTYTTAASTVAYTGTIPTVEAETDPYTVTENSLFSIIPQEKMTIEISVDELDISGLKVGQKVIVTLDSLKGQSFDGTVESIASEGTYDSGNTKYAVTVSVPRTEQMLSGMNAGIRIEVANTDECITVPVAALVESSGKTYVYTTYDEKNDELGGLVEVTTGISDGEEVQILSGLDNTSKVYYKYADTIEYKFSNR